MSDMRRTNSIKWIMARTLGGGIVFCLVRVLLSVFGWTAKQLGPLTPLELISWFLTGLCRLHMRRNGGLAVRRLNLLCPFGKAAQDKRFAAAR
jgi:hypothetical protein